MNKKIIYTLMAGSLSGLSFLFGNPFFLIFIAFFSNFINKEKSKKYIFIYSLFFMYGLLSVSLFWIFDVFNNIDNELNLSKIHLPIVFLFQSTLFSIILTILNINIFKKISFPFVFSLGWILFEYIRGFLVGGNSWINIGSIGIEIELIKVLYPFFGELGVSFFIIYIISLLSIFNKKNAILAIVLISTVFLFNKYYKENNINHEEIKVESLQPNISEEKKWNNEYFSNLIFEIEDSIYKSKSELIVLPETAFPTQYEAIEEKIIEINENLKKQNKTVISGIFKSKNKNSFNPMYSAIIIMGLNNGFFYKEKLIPFFEENKTYEWLYKLLGFKILEENSIVSYKENQENLEIKINKNNIKIAGAICYEITYESKIRERLKNTDILFLLSNMGAFKNEIGQEQQFKIARVRAAENGKYVVVSSNTGVSGIINNYGDVIKRTKNFKKDNVIGDIKIIKNRTIFNKYGYILLFFLIFLFFIINFIIKREK